jgi:hypothetical protein
MTFHTAVANMAQTATDDLIGLVVRWNHDDGKLATLWSEPPGNPANPANPAVDDRPTMLRFVDDNNPRGGVRAALKQSDAAGYHAEELLIACWPKLLADANLVEPAITSVELVLSKTPCSGHNGSSPLVVCGDNLDTRYKTSCAEKLYAFCSARRGTSFKIYYLALAGAHAGSYRLDSIKGGFGVDRAMTPEEARLEQHRGALAALQSRKDGYLAQAQGAIDAFSHAAATLKSAAVPEAQKALLRPQMGALKNAAKPQQDAARRLDLQIVEERIGARHVSLTTAQQGIVRLQSLANVDVVRWHFAIGNPDLRGRASRR